MSQSVPYCQPCRQSRNLELEQIKAEKAARRKAKGKGRAKGWGSGSDAGSSDEEEGEWGKGEPGIMKVGLIFGLQCEVLKLIL
jgi:NAD-dependent histone deacetylase SIR2